MESLSIADVPWISKRIKACCRRAKLFSTHELLLTNPSQLQHALRIPQHDVDRLLLHVATAAAAPTISVLDALNAAPAPPLDPHLFRSEAREVESDDSSHSDDADELGYDARLPPPSAVPPTQGYEGNYPGAHQFVYDSDSDADSEPHSDTRYRDSDMLDDVEAPARSPLELDHSMQQMDAAQWEASPGAALARDALSLGRPRHVLTTGSVELDALLAGGLRTSLLTELVGESGSGKTQIAIQSCVYAALGLVALPTDMAPPPPPPPMHETSSTTPTLRSLLQGYGMQPPGRGGGEGVDVCYITSDGERGAHSIVARALELAEAAIRDRLPRRLPADPSHLADDTDGEQDALASQERVVEAVEVGRAQMLGKLHVACVADIEALEHALKYALPALIQRRAGEVGMVVVDNLPALFHDDPVAGDIDSLTLRSRALADVADALKRIAATYTSRSPRAGVGVVVMVLNHVSDAFGADRELARRYVMDSALRARTCHPHVSVLPDHPATIEYAAQSAYTSGLLATIPPTLAEAMAANSHTQPPADGPLYVLHPKAAQLGHTWSNLIHTRIVLSRTTGRIPIPHPPTQSEAESKRYTTVRKAAVVLNPNGPSMFDLPAPNAHLRFVITPSTAIHALKPYHLTTLSTLPSTQHPTPFSQPPVSGAN